MIFVLKSYMDDGSFGIGLKTSTSRRVEHTRKAKKKTMPTMRMVDWKSIHDIAEEILYTNEDEDGNDNGDDDDDDDDDD